DAQGGNLSAQLGGGGQVSEGGEGRRVGVVVGRHVDGLQRSDRTAARRGDALLELTHLVGQGGLITDRARHAPQQRRYFGTGLDEAEDVVDEEQYVLILHVAEVLGHRERSQGHAQAHARRLVHLTVDQGRLFDNARFAHFQQKVG